MGESKKDTVLYADYRVTQRSLDISDILCALLRLLKIQRYMVLEYKMRKEKKTLEKRKIAQIINEIVYRL